MEILETLRHLVLDLGTLLVQLLVLGWHWGLLLAWLAWWLWGVNWGKVWPVLARGAWVPLLLLTVFSAMAWAQLDPVPLNCLGVLTVPNFWWQLCGVALVVGLTLLCGWVQGVLNYAPPELELNPPPSADHGHADVQH